MGTKGCKTILLIEDDQPIREIIEHALELEGYTVVTAGDGREGLARLQEVTRPCLILLDLMLPIMNGWEFLNELRSHDGDMLAPLPVVITSAAGTPAQSAIEKSQGYIKKPFDLDLLLKTVEKFCGPAPASQIPTSHAS